VPSSVSGTWCPTGDEVHSFVAMDAACHPPSPHSFASPRWVRYSEHFLVFGWFVRASSTRTLWAPCNVSVQVGPGGTCPDALQRSLHPSLQCRGPCLRGCSPCTFQRFVAHCTSRSTCLVVTMMALTEAAKA
jgi:hypothetical protein